MRYLLVPHLSRSKKSSAQAKIVKELKKDLSVEEHQVREAKMLVEDCAKAIESHRKERREKLIEQQRVQSNVEQLQDILDQNQVEEGRLDALKSHLNEVNDEIATHESSYEEACVEKDRLFQSLRTAREGLEANERSLYSAKAALSKAETRANDRISERMGILREKNVAFEKVKAGKEDKQQRLKDRKDKDDDVQDFIRQADQVSVRIVVDQGETEATLERKYQKLEIDLAQMKEK